MRLLCCALVCGFILGVGGLALAQPAAPLDPRVGAGSDDPIRDGYFEININTPEGGRLNVEELLRDRELNPAALYRVSSGGYLSFNETDWVKKMEFKIYDVPVTELPQYRRFANLLQDINDRIADMNRVLTEYDQTALKLINMCDKSRFSDIEKIDDSIAPYLLINVKLLRLRDLVVHSLNRFARERSCRTQFLEYDRALMSYADALSKITKDFNSLVRRSLAISRDVSQLPSGGSASPGQTGR